MARITKPVEERKQEIIDTARAMFIKKGFDKTQMADISKKMDVAAGTVYHYFKSKTELLYAVIDELVYEKTQKRQQILSQTKGSALDRLKIIVKAFEQGKFHEDSNSSFLSDPAIIQYYFSIMGSSYLPFFLSLIEQGNADGSWVCEYPKETAVFIQKGIEGVMSKEQEHRDSSQEKSKRLKAYTNFIFRVLGIEKS
jgi:AcrR family transcriptional regulator